MQGKPWMKFFCRDWRADGRLKLCSLAACGLWVELLALMHDEGEPYGHLRIGGAAITDPEEVAAAVGRPVREVKPALAELIARGVPSVADDGCLYSRRMVRDEEVRQRRAAGGFLGGNPALVAADDEAAKDNHPRAPKDKGAHARGRALTLASAVGGGNGKAPHHHPLPAELNTPEVIAALADFEQHRIQKRSRMTAKAWELLLAKLARMGPERAVAALNHSITNGWTGVFEPDDDTTSKPARRGPHTSTRTAGSSPTLLAQLAAAEAADG